MLDLGISISTRKPLTKTLIVEWVCRHMTTFHQKLSLILGSMVPILELIVMKLIKHVSYICILNHSHEINYLFIFTLKFTVNINTVFNLIQI